jgi:hypothetical protein
MQGQEEPARMILSSRKNHIRHDYWATVAVVFLVGGATLAMPGFLALTSFDVLVPFPQTLAFAGVAGMGLGVWILIHPSDLVFDSQIGILTLRSPVRKEAIWLRDVAGVRSQPNQSTLHSFSDAGKERYDVVLLGRTGAEIITVHRDVTLETAYFEAGSLAELLGKPVVHC